MYLICTKNAIIKYLNTFKIINWERLQANDLRAEVNPGMLLHPT